MAFKVRTEVRPDPVGVKVSTIPAEFLAAMDNEYAAVLADPTREIILTGETPAETTLYVQWAKSWGLRHDPELFVTKQPARKTDAPLDARLSVVLKADAPKRGRKTNAEKAETPANEATPEVKAESPAPEVKAESPKPEPPKHSARR